MDKYFHRSAKGAISIFVALMMAGILSLGTFVLEAARFQAAKTQLQEATVSAATSMLSSYNSDLYERYGLLAIDSLRSNDVTCREYMDFNSDLATGYFGNNVTRLYKISGVSMKGIYNLTYPKILERQLMTIAKYNLTPEDSQFNKYTAAFALDELQAKCQYVSSVMETIYTNFDKSSANQNAFDQDVKKSIYAIENTLKNDKSYNDKHNVVITNETYAKLPSVTGTIESIIPEGDKDSVKAVLNDTSKYLGDTSSVLESSATAPETEVEISINLSVLDLLEDYGMEESPIYIAHVATNKQLALEYKNLADTVNAAINILETDRDSNLLLNSYISRMFSNRNFVAGQYIGPGMEVSEKNKNNMTFAKACCEYIFGGNASEIDNQSEAYDYVMAVRLIGNLYATLTESNSLNVNDRYSVAKHLAWAYYETIVDMKLLTEYNVPIPLTKEALILPVNDHKKVSDAFFAKDFVKAMTALGCYDKETASFIINGRDCFDYTDSLSLALWFVPNSHKLLRVADLVQLEMRYKQQYVDKLPATFLMSEQNTYCRVESTANLNSLLPMISIGGVEHSLQGHSMRSVKYTGY